MKFIVYRRLHLDRYVVEKLFNEETYEVFTCERDDDPLPHIIIRDSDGNQRNLLTGEFVEVLDDEAKSRVQAKRLNSVNDVMES